MDQNYFYSHNCSGGFLHILENILSLAQADLFDKVLYHSLSWYSCVCAGLLFYSLWGLIAFMTDDLYSCPPPHGKERSTSSLTFTRINCQFFSLGIFHITILGLINCTNLTSQSYDKQFWENDIFKRIKSYDISLESYYDSSISSVDIYKCCIYKFPRDIVNFLLYFHISWSIRIVRCDSFLRVPCFATKLFSLV